MTLKIHKLPIQPLTKEAFRPYGEILDHDTQLYPDADPDAGGFELRLYHLRVKPKLITQIAFHDSYTQGFIVLRGALVMVVAPPQKNGQLTAKGELIDYDGVRAFLFEAGQATHIYRGTGHFAVPVGEVCHVINITRRHRPEQRPIEQYVEGKGGKFVDTKEIEFVSFGDRDQRAFQIEF